MNHHSRNESILESRRKESRKLDPIFSNQDLASVGITNRAQRQFLESTIWGMDRIVKAFNRRSE